MYEEGEKTKIKKDATTVAGMIRHAKGADQQKLISPAEYLRREQILSFFSRITASRRRNVSFKDMLGQGSDTEDADSDIEECLEELQAEQDLAFLKEQIDDLERNELDAEDTSVTTCRVTTRKLSHNREIEVYPDICCIFRAVVVCCDMELQFCSRSLSGWPSVSSLVVKWTRTTDKLQEETALMVRKNVKLFHSSWRDMGLDVNFDADYGTLDSHLNRNE